MIRERAKALIEAHAEAVRELDVYLHCGGALSGSTYDHLSGRVQTVEDWIIEGLTR